MMRRWGALMVCMNLLAVAAFAQDEVPALEQSDSLNLVAASNLAAKFGWLHTMTLPVLRGDGALLEGNNLRMRTTLELSPVSLNVKGEAVLVPIAFLQVFASGGAGSGWNIPVATGLAINTEASATAPRGEPFESLVWYGRVGATLQLDLAALVPGDWNHIVIQVNQALRYMANTGATGGESWYWENDDGENLNGWSWQAVYVFGYQMPLFVNLVALMAECEVDLYGSVGGDLWGEGEPYWVFGPIINVQFTEDISLALIAQARTRRVFTSATRDEAWYRNRVLDAALSPAVEFYRAVLNATWVLP